jgi:type I restriction enzyme R subunit
MATSNQNPEQEARDRIDKMLEQAGWAVQSKDRVNHSASKGVAIREWQVKTPDGEDNYIDYTLFVNREPIGLIEAKRESEGHRINMVEEQAAKYAKSQLKYLNNDTLPFVYESTGTITRFTDLRDPKPRAREVFYFHRPETLEEWFKQAETLRQRLFNLPHLNPDGLRPAQIVAIENLEQSFKENKPKALIQMATGAGKTFTASTFVYRLLKHAHAKRILFLVDTKNLGEQAEQEFMKYQPRDDNRKFTELYNVQRLNSSYIASDSQVCISTIQRLYSILKGEELEEAAEQNNPNESSWMEQRMKEKEALPVVYNEKIPIEQFDFIIIDECHRSIYNLWKQVLDYFDAFLIGLTATPDKRTFGFFNQNVVSEYTYEESVVDGVNVPYDVYTIETKISKDGDLIEAGWFVDRRDKLSRAKRWQQEDEDVEYFKNDLDKKVVNISQIRTIIKEFRSALKSKIYPERKNADGEYEVPKTLIFAKTDSHADDIINIVREEFGEGNDFCKKVTYKIEEDPKTVLAQFRNSYYPRIAVTVDMIATGTDVKALEVLLFMRDVKSVNYFEQMKGRGTRTLDSNDLQSVSRRAAAKTHFVIVDAVGATKSKKTDSRPLERKKSVPMKDLLQAVMMGAKDEDLYLSLANRLLRLDKQISPKEAEHITTLSGGADLKQISKDLIEAYNPDAQEELADNIQTEQSVEAGEAEQLALQQLTNRAADHFNGELNEYLENVRREHEQIIDHRNLDEVLQSDWDKSSAEQAQQIVQEFETYLKEHQDEITALQIFYQQPYQRREVTYQMIKEVLEKLKLQKPQLAPHYVWEAYAQLDSSVGNAPKKDLTTLVSLVRKASGIDEQLTPYDKTVDENFRKWIFEQNAGQHNRFTEEQMQWLREIKAHVQASFHVDVEDLDYTPFDKMGRRGKFWQLFGEESTALLEELNEILVA